MDITTILILLSVGALFLLGGFDNTTDYLMGLFILFSIPLWLSWEFEPVNRYATDTVTAYCMAEGNTPQKQTTVIPYRWEFSVDRSTQSVTSKVVETGYISKKNDCTVVDKFNWKCGTEGVLDEGKMVDGLYRLGDSAKRFILAGRQMNGLTSTKFTCTKWKTAYWFKVLIH